MKDNPAVWLAVLLGFIAFGFFWSQWTKTYLDKLARDEARLRDDSAADSDSSSPSGVDPLK